MLAQKGQTGESLGRAGYQAVVEAHVGASMAI